MPFSWMLLYLHVFMFVAQFIPTFGLVLTKCWLWLPFGISFTRTGGRSDIFLPDFSVFQLLSYSFFHPGFFMLLFNLLGIYTCARILEEHWGEKRFLLFYLVCALGDGLLQLLIAALSRSSGFVMGAAGPMFGLLMAMALLHRDKEIDPPWLPKMPVMVFMIGLGVLMLLIGKGPQSFSVQFVHLISGALFGWLVLSYWRWKDPLPENIYGDEEEEDKTN